MIRELALGVLSGTVLLSLPALMPSDKSYYREADPTQWPGDSLSPQQYEAAVLHFSRYPACKTFPKWARIAPEAFLLEGTRYLVTEVSERGYVANVHYLRGYWGDSRGMYLSPSPNMLIKTQAELDATMDCLTHKSMFKLSHNDLSDNSLVPEAYRYDLEFSDKAKEQY